MKKQGKKSFMPKLVGLRYCDITAVEQKFGLRFSENERYVINGFSKEEMEVIARFELLKMRSSFEYKINCTQRKLWKTEDGSKEHFDLSEEIHYLEIKLADVEERLGIKI